MKKVLEKEGVEVLFFNPDADNFSPFSRNDMIITGSPTGGDGLKNIQDFIHKCPYINGGRVSVFVSRQWWGSDKTIKNLMSGVESSGGTVFDFAVIDSDNSAEKFARRLLSLKKTLG